MVLPFYLAYFLLRYIDHHLTDNYIGSAIYTYHPRINLKK